MKTRARHHATTDRPAPGAAAGTPPEAPGTRERIIRAASALMQRQGYDATPIKQISQEADATLGSVYHFFPGGKQELAVAAVHRGDEEFSAILRELLDAEPDPAAAITILTDSLAEGLRDSDWADGCPVTATALGTAGRLPDIQRAAAAAFDRWEGLVREKLAASGVPEAEAADLACTIISTLEGAELAAQVTRDDRPLRLAGRHLARLVALSVQP
ncbi:TetR/AcrR family transcriptional regulator [Streptomyces qinzhouensis]|uniref:TetR/AcrR family transcriptional regulator n=1 Tax=Streptomyces qinzhouensis TaxID=2599401 RepID=A0A5B8JCG0_9ACTN|nr:TetR/AcrR family transcriptional regulator [Streptomyces qinzhouensis]QDY77601.1 TetR/AcrR family transcriptional regulator [Streptomyces qinzhouensis]